MRVCTGYTWLGIGTMLQAPLNTVMDFLGSVKDGKFLDLLSDYQLLRLNSVP
jgi:hypothetical protein